MPKLWSATVDEHRRSVQDAILESSWALVRERGLLSVNMSEIAQRAGIGRATLYKYFPDVESILLAFHRQHVAAHVAQLHSLRGEAGTAGEALAAVLGRYALGCYQRSGHGTELVSLLHRGDAMDHAEGEVLELFGGLLADAVSDGRVRADVAPEELASYCLHALAAAGGLTSEAAVHRLVDVILNGLHPGIEPPA